MHGGADSELIEFIESDPSVFGPSTRERPPPTPRTLRTRPSWTLPVAVVVVSILAAAALLVIWKPWVNEFHVRLALPSTPHVEPTLTEQLVFGNPPGTLALASVGGAVGISNTLTNADGYLFAGANATLNLGQGGSGRWAAFFAGRSDAADPQSVPTGDGAVEVTVQGAPGAILTSLDSQNIEVNFGPIDGRVTSVVTSELTQRETLAFAETATFENGVPVVSDAGTLVGLQPLGDISSFGSVFSFVATAANPASPEATVVTAQYGPEEKRFTVTSHVADDTDLKLLRFVLGGDVNAQVHGQQALTYVANPSESLLALRVELGSVVAWVEGGRLIMVTGKLEVPELLKLAETVRPATADEWAQVIRVAANTVNTADTANG